MTKPSKARFPRPYRVITLLDTAHQYVFVNHGTVETSKLFPGEVQGLYAKLINSETTASYYANRRTYNILQLKGIMIFDTRTGHFVSNREFISVDTPPLGGVAHFDDYIARYIGFGNWP